MARGIGWHSDRDIPQRDIIDRGYRRTDDPGESYSRRELSSILSQALEGLATPSRAVFALRDMEGFSSEETASVLGLPPAAVTTCLARARLELRQHLSAWFENPSDPAIEQGECEIARHSLGPVLAGDRECP